MNSRSIKWIVLMLAMALFIPSFLFAQTTGSSLSGRLQDSTGGAVPGVTITATNAQTGLTRTTVPANDGKYRFLALPVGTYKVTAELPGFATVTTENVEQNVATERNVNVTLKQATVSEAITVTAEVPLVATTPAVGTVVSQR